MTSSDSIARAPLCPRCGAVQALPIIWGMPVGDPGSDVVVGGCVLPDGPVPDWECRGCGTRFGESEH